MSYVRNDHISIWKETAFRLKDFWLAIRHIPSWLKKCFQYSIFLWSDYDFDSHYALRLLGFKLKRIRERIASDNILLYTDRYCKQIKYAEFLIDRIMKDDYFPELQAKIDEEFGELDFSFTPAPDHPGHHQMNFCSSKCKTEEDNKRASDARHNLYRKQNAELDKDYERLFRHLKRYWRKWWD